MRLVAVTLENFRSYREPTRIEFGDLTTIIGRNDIGKSTILEALEVFFNGEVVKIEQSDANVRSQIKDVTITAEFSDLPEEITLDAGAPTSLAAEYLLAGNGNLIVRKSYDCSKKAPSGETALIAMHPSAEGVSNLLELKEKELQTLMRDRNIEGPLKGNPSMRQAIWQSAGDLKLVDTAIPVSKAKEDGKRVWEQIELHLPLFALFQSDRASKESDDEVQNPLRAAIKTAIAEAQDDIDRIQARVREKSLEIARLTHDALQQIDPRLANTLTPTFSPPTAAKWTGLFSLGMDTDDNIPLNKRGSGVRRLILVSFFKAEAERKLASGSKANLIYAIEEPETSQHPANQRILIESFKDISNTPNCQVVLTTHSPGLASDLPVESIRFISTVNTDETPTVQHGADVFGSVADALGVTPDSRVKVLFCVEGPSDVEALKALSSVLHEHDEMIPDLRNEPRVAFISLGGGTLKQWVSSNYLRELHLPEVHLYDSDVAAYGASVNEVLARTDGLNSWAGQTKKYEIESYLHPDAIHDAFGVDVQVEDQPTPEVPAVPRAFAIAYSAHQGYQCVLSDSKAKRHLTQAFEQMTAARIQERDPDGEVAGWFMRLSGYF